MTGLDKKKKNFNLENLRFSLVFPAYREYRDTISLPENKRHLGIIPPLSLAYVAAILEQANCKVQLIDASALNLTKDLVVDELRNFNPDFLGFTSTTLDFHNTLDWIKHLKEKMGLPIIIGGVHLSAYPKETLTHQAIDYGIVGEAEEALPELLEYLVNKKNLNKVRGICYRDNGRIVITESRPPIQNLDECPSPARHLLPNDRYYSLISKRKNFTVMLTSRGCPYRCIFCDSQSVLYRYRSPENVVDEMEHCHNLFKINEIDMFDALFSVRPDRVMQICRQIKRRGLELRWTFRTRVDLVTGKMLEELKEAGCARIYYGIESGDDNILKNINKRVDIEMVKRIVSLTKEKGIDTFGYFMFGNPGENKDTVRKTIRLILELPLDYVQISPVFTPPNTVLYEILKKEMGKDYWAEYTLSSSKNDLLPRYGTDLTDRQIKKYVREAYLKFYLKLSYILKFVTKLRSWDEFIRSARALKDMILSLYFENQYERKLRPD